MSTHEVPFLSASTVPLEALIVSEIIGATTHWDTAARRPRLCGFENCKLCRDGWGTKERFAVRLEDRGGYHSLMELGPRHAEQLREVSRVQGQGRSCWVEIWKLGSASNSPVHLDILRVVSFSNLFDLRNLVKKMYLPALLVEAEQGDVDSSFPGSGNSIQDTGLCERDLQLQRRFLELQKEKT